MLQLSIIAHLFLAVLPLMRLRRCNGCGGFVLRLAEAGEWSLLAVFVGIVERWVFEFEAHGGEG